MKVELATEFPDGSADYTFEMTANEMEVLMAAGLEQIQSGRFEDHTKIQWDKAVDAIAQLATGLEQLATGLEQLPGGCIDEPIKIQWDKTVNAVVELGIITSIVRGLKKTEATSAT